MLIRFRTKTLKAHYADQQKAERAYGRIVARKYIQRVNIIKQAADIHELMTLPALRCHKLKGRLKGRYAVKLTVRYRLIFILEGDRLEIACIEEVSKHYGD